MLWKFSSFWLALGLLCGLWIRSSAEAAQFTINPSGTGSAAGNSQTITIDVQCGVEPQTWVVTWSASPTAGPVNNYGSAARGTMSLENINGQQGLWAGVFNTVVEGATSGTATVGNSTEGVSQRLFWHPTYPSLCSVGDTVWDLGPWVAPPDDYVVAKFPDDWVNSYPFDIRIDFSQTDPDTGDPVYIGSYTIPPGGSFPEVEVGPLDYDTPVEVRTYGEGVTSQGNQLIISGDITDEVELTPTTVPTITPHQGTGGSVTTVPGPTPGTTGGAAINPNPQDNVIWQKGNAETENLLTVETFREGTQAIVNAVRNSGGGGGGVGDLSGLESGIDGVNTKLEDTNEKLDGIHEALTGGGQSQGEALDGVEDGLGEAGDAAGTAASQWEAPEYEVGAQTKGGTIPTWKIDANGFEIDLSIGPWLAEFSTPISAVRALATMVVLYMLLRSVMDRVHQYIVGLVAAPQTHVNVGTENAIPGVTAGKGLVLSGLITAGIIAGLVGLFAVVDFVVQQAGGMTVAQVFAYNYLGELGWVVQVADTLVPLTTMCMSALMSLLADFLIPPVYFVAATVVRFLSA